MPRFDRTGPEGQGPKTGRGLGKCNPSGNRTGEETGTSDFRRGRGPGSGLRPGRGSGRGFRGGNSQ